MSLTRKHFELLATTLRCQYSSHEINEAHSMEAEVEEAWGDGFDAAITAVVSVCSAANPRFDEKKFRSAVYQST